MMLRTTRIYACTTLLLLIFVIQHDHAIGANPSGLNLKGHLQAVVQEQSGNFSYVRLASGIQICVGSKTKNILFYGPKTVRVNTNLGESFWDHPSIVVDSSPAQISFQLHETNDILRVRSAELELKVNKETGSIAFYNSHGELYTTERQSSPETVVKATALVDSSYEVSNTFSLKEGEGIYGFGYVNPESLNRRDKELTLIQTNIGIVIPFMISSERYGIMWDTYSAMRFKDAEEGATLWVEDAPGGVDYYFFGGDDLDEVISGYRKLTGESPMYPKQAFGLFMSKERYRTQKQILEVAQKFREKNFPLDYIVQDWQYWGGRSRQGWDGRWSGMVWDEKRFPSPKELTDAIHDLNMKLMISIWPSVGNETDIARELDKHGLRFAPLHWISKKARVYDAFSPAGREIYFKHIKKGLLDNGVDALWMDGTEVEVGSACHSAADTARDIKGLGRNAMGDFSRYLNPYSLMTTKGTYEGQRSTSIKRVFTLTRSAWAGAQRYAAASWSGDTRASWQTLRDQIAGGLSVTMAGNPYWTQDIGGFFVKGFPGGENNPQYQELFARWFQYGVFNPIMRVHGTSIKREPYIFEDKNPAVYKSLLDAVHLRYRLLPYIYSQSWQVTSKGGTLMRGLVMDFPQDPIALDINDEFMFGPALLVHPVTRPMGDAYAPLETVPTTALSTLDGTPGISVQYFKGIDFDAPAGTEIDVKVDHTWPGPPLADPPPGLDGYENFSGRWEGFLTAPETGIYEIGLEGDDGYRLYVDGKIAVEHWSQHAESQRTKSLSLKAGQKIKVLIEYYQAKYDRSLRLVWRVPSQQTDNDIRRFEVATYLPAGTDWYDFWTHKKYSGGQTVTTFAKLDQIPMFVRAGSILPLGPVVQYATQDPDAPYEVRIYPGADGIFTLYEDDNETYAYENGDYATIDLQWDDASHTLTICDCKGSFPGMVAERQFNCSIAHSNSPGGVNPTVPIERMNYSGNKMQSRITPTGPLAATPPR